MDDRGAGQLGRDGGRGRADAQVVRVRGDAGRREQPTPADAFVLDVVPLRAVGCVDRMGEGQHADRIHGGQYRVALWPAAVQVDRDRRRPVARGQRADRRAEVDVDDRVDRVVEQRDQGREEGGGGQHPFVIGVVVA